jgi:hypothetical protein
LCRLPRLLYFKRFHDDNLHTKWLGWPLEKRKAAWKVHCRDMFLEAAQAEATTDERRLMWSAAVGRLVSRLAAHYLPLAEFDADERRQLLAGFLDCFGQRAAEAETALDLPWTAIEARSRTVFEANR